MTAPLALLHLAVLLAAPPLLLGIVTRTRSLWAGRKGPRLLQGYADLARLLRKEPVLGEVTTAVARLGPLVLLATTVVSGLMVPLLGGAAPISFPFDFVVVAYLWGLGRIALVLAALDTGSSLEGMGASREATYATLAEPTLFLALGTLAAATGRSSFADLVRLGHRGPAEALVALGSLAAILVVLQVEAARVPIDDPATHLELTMIHEVMVLDHAGPELAAVGYATAMKFTLLAAVAAAIALPAVPGLAWLAWLPPGVAAAGATAALAALVAVVVGTVESLVARLKLTAVPAYVAAGAAAALAALLATAWRQGGAP